MITNLDTMSAATALDAEVTPAPTGKRASGVLGRMLVAMMLAVALTAATVAITSTPAEASTVRPGARAGQIDVLLDGIETQRAATGYWGAQSVCWGVTGAAFAVSPVFGTVLANLVCTSMVSVCAAQAYVKRRWAGMTVYPGGFFCWQY